MNGKQKLILEIMFLAYAVHEQTEYCVFINFSGHVDSLEIQICPSKDEYQTKIASTHFYTKKYHNEDNGWLKSKRDHLLQILKDGEIDVSGMDQEIEQIVHSFF